MSDEELRTCVKCAEKKPLSEFSPEPIIESGYKVKCRSCEKEDMKKWLEHTKEKKVARNGRVHRRNR